MRHASICRWILSFSLSLPIITAFIGTPVRAEGEDGVSLAIVPGKWDFEFSTLLASATEPQRTLRTQCIATDVLDPGSFLLGKEGTGCQISDVKVEGKTMSWAQACAKQKGSSVGRAEATVDGDSASGKLEMHIVIGSHPIPVVTTWSAKRVGSCDEAPE